MEQRKIAITVSIGLASMDPGDTDAQQVLLRADRALYRAKACGRNRVETAIVETPPPPVLPPATPDLPLEFTGMAGESNVSSVLQAHPLLAHRRP